MHYVTVPPRRQLTIQHGPQTAVVDFDFCTMLVHNTWTVDPKYGGSVALLLEAADVRALFDQAKPGDIVEVPDTLWVTLADVVQKPSSPYHPEIMLLLLDELQAFLASPTVDPRPRVPAAPTSS